MSREEDLKRDRNWNDKAYAQGVSPQDNPYYGITEDEWQRRLAGARNADERAKFEEYRKRSQREQAEMLREMTPEQRAEYDRIKEREEYYSGKEWDPEKRRAAMQRDLDNYELLQRAEEREDQKRREGINRNLAVKYAKMRYNSLSSFSKLFHKKPQHVDFDSMSTEEISKMYGGKAM